MNAIIVISSIHLVFDSPLLDPEGNFIKILEMIDLSITIVFTIELVAKLVAFGAVFNGEKSYFRNIWNVFDFFIVACSVNIDFNIF